MGRFARVVVLFLVGLLAACGGEGDGGSPGSPWKLVASGAPEALLSVSGRSSVDVYAVGADKGRGPLVLHYDGSGWQRLETGTRGDLWWVAPIPGGPVLIGGADGTILRYEDGTFERMKTPGLARHTIYGIWGRGPDDVYAVGAVAGRGGFVWHWDGAAWTEVPTPDDALPRTADGDIHGFFKVWGNDQGDVWVVGGRGVLLHTRDRFPFVRVNTGIDETLLTIHALGDRAVAVGGDGAAALLEIGSDGTVKSNPPAANALQGVFLGPRGEGWAVGFAGHVFREAKGRWVRDDHRLPLVIESLHAVWVDETGGVWAAGGNVISASLDDGVLLHRGGALPGADAAVGTIDDGPPDGLHCPEAEIDPAPHGSIARRWNEQALAAIRRNVPHPGVHARNLFHLSAAMWDVWAVYDPGATGLFFHEKIQVDDVDAARHEAISHAAFRLLTHRYSLSTGAETSTECFRVFMDRLGYDRFDETLEGDSPAAVGNRVAAAVIASALDDGANEPWGYKDTTGFVSVNPPLVVEEPGAKLVDPSVWQPLNLEVAITQNGLPGQAGAQTYIGAHWGKVRPFAMHRLNPDSLYHDPGPAPAFGPEIVADVVEVIRLSSELDDDTSIDTSPGGMGNNSLGRNDGIGHSENPLTGRPYDTQKVRMGDFARVLAEFWADGPKSETPPGHWNVLANGVADHPSFERRLGGVGEELDPLAWDVKTYLALNGALHDAAIAAWEIKRHFLGVRPISLIRYMGGLGQRTDTSLPSWHPDGLPLVPGLIEVITDESAAPGERHAHLARFRGQIAIRSWRGEPGDRKGEIGGVGWIRAVEWMPYQLRTFVTPAFPGFISGHSTFSRAAAEVLTTLTGSPWFPGGLAEFVASPGYLQFEAGPSTEVRLQWGTYYDAADQAGRSRLWGGIHIEPDDRMGRQIGRAVGVNAVQRALSLYGGDGALPLH